MKFKKPSLTEKILLVASAVVLTAMFLPSCLAIRSFDQIEDKAHKAITGAELQAWATNLLANPPTTIDVRISELVTNFPQRLFGLYQDPPFIRIRPAETNSPGSVFLMWGGGLIGHCGFEIGNTNFVGRGHAWQPGVYFWSDEHR